MNILFILLTIFIIIIIYYIYFKNIEKFEIPNICITNSNICNNYNKQKFIFDLYTNINYNLNSIIPQLISLNDPALKNVGQSLSNINDLISKLLLNVTNNYERASSYIKQYKCKCPMIESFQTLSAPTFTAVTAGDNILLSMLYLRANVEIYSNAAKDIDLFVWTCIGISNSITTLIYNITTESVTNIIGNNLKALTQSLNNANNGVIANINYGNNLITIYIENIKKIICTITNDNTYVNTINSMSQSRRDNFIKSFISILKINVVNYPKMNNQKINNQINNFNNTILTKNNIFDQKSEFNIKNCKIKK